MLCSKCGQQMDDSDIFCTRCGSKLDKFEDMSDPVIAGKETDEKNNITIPEIEKTISISRMYGYKGTNELKYFDRSEVSQAEDDHLDIADGFKYRSQFQNTSQNKQQEAHTASFNDKDNNSSESQDRYEGDSGNRQTVSVDTISKRNLSFAGAIKMFFLNYLNFRGRASKSEFWWGLLFTVLMSFTILGGIVCYIGMLSLSIRRLHDIGKKWMWIFMGLVPFVGIIIIIIFYCRESTGDNVWGSQKNYN